MTASHFNVLVCNATHRRLKGSSPSRFDILRRFLQQECCKTSLQLELHDVRYLSEIGPSTCRRLQMVKRDRFGVCLGARSRLRAIASFQVDGARNSRHREQETAEEILKKADFHDSHLDAFVLEAAVSPAR